MTNTNLGVPILTYGIMGPKTPTVAKLLGECAAGQGFELMMCQSCQSLQHSRLCPVNHRSQPIRLFGFKGGM